METPDTRAEFAAAPPTPQPVTDLAKSAVSSDGSGVPSVQFFTSSIVGDPAPVYGSNAPINPYTALQIPAVWRAVNFLASNLANFPKQVFRRIGDKRSRDYNHPLNWLLNDEPSSLTTSNTFFETLYHHAIVYGNGYALIDRDASGSPTALYNLPPDRINPFRFNGEQWYSVEGMDGKLSAVPAASILHIAGLGYDGMKGYGVMYLMQQALGIARATQTFTQKFFTQGGMLGGVIETDSKLTPEQSTELLAGITRGYMGLDSAHKWMLLSSGLKAKALGGMPENSQLAATISQSDLDICRIVGVEPFTIFSYREAKWANIEQQNTTVVQYSLMPWILKSEAEFNKKLFSTAERRQQGYYVAFNVDALVRGDHSQQIESAVKRSGGPVTTINEERALMDLPPVPGGDIVRTAVNQVPLGSQATAPEAPPAAMRASYSNDKPATPAITLEHFRPMLAYAADKVHGKTDKAKAAAMKKLDTPAWIPWVNTFSAEQESYAAEAIAPVLQTYGSSAAVELDHDRHAKRIGRTYGSKLRGHLYSLGKGGATTAPDLTEIVFTHDLKGADDETEN